jgi:hypothetical protein
MNQHCVEICMRALHWSSLNAPRSHRRGVGLSARKRDACGKQLSRRLWLPYEKREPWQRPPMYQKELEALRL